MACIRFNGRDRTVQQGVYLVTQVGGGGVRVNNRGVVL